MNILREYTLDYARRNKKSSASIMVAILISTVLLSFLCGALYTFYSDDIRLIKQEGGDWHAELFDNTPGEKLKYVTEHPNVESVMIKGTWKIARLDDPRRPYLAIRGFNASYWLDMPEHTAILEGRVPQAEDELAVSKQYFEAHPGLNVGDRVTLSLGSRKVNGMEVDLIAPYKEGEAFVPEKEQVYTIVAKLDIATNSMTPYYIACGYLDNASILPDDQLTVYMRFKNPRSAYEDINRIARSVGFAPDEYGKYAVKTNNALLAKYLIFPPEKRSDINLWMLSQPLMIAAIAVLAAGVFVFIIHNAFAMSANARLKQLGMLQSIGASPRQIRQSVVFEGLLLSAIPIPVGLFIGWALDYALFAYTNSVRSLRYGMDGMVFSYGWPVVLPAALLALLTVWLSALLPARKISKLSPISAIRQGGTLSVRKIRKHGVYARIFGIEGELAQNALHARRASYRTASISLTLSFLLFSLFLNLMAVNDTRVSIKPPNTAAQSDISVHLQNGHLTDQQFEQELRSANGVKSVVFASQIHAGLWLSADAESDELRAIGGFKRVIQSGKYDVYEENGSFRIRTNLLALDDQSFADYCRQLGVDASEFFNTPVPRTIVVNDVRDDVNSNPRRESRIPFLKLAAGDRLQSGEKVYPGDTGSYTFETEVGFVTNRMPETDSRFGGYQLAQVMPRSQYLSIVEHLQETRSVRAKRVSAVVLAQSEAAIPPAADAIGEICGRWYGSGDYLIWNRLEQQQAEADGRNLMSSVMLFISGLLAVIGISNVFSTVSGTLRQRQKEFAMLRSVGLSPKGMRSMLALEGLIFGLMPIVLSTPLNLAIVGLFLRINMIGIGEYLPSLPVLPVGAFAAAILLSVLGAYALGGKMLRRAAIVDVLKEEAV